MQHVVLDVVAYIGGGGLSTRDKTSRVFLNALTLFFLKVNCALRTPNSRTYW